jgi:hypothetical protein
MSKHYFCKEILSNTLTIGGTPVPFEDIGDNNGGIIVEESDPIYNGLLDFIKRKVGGVYEVTEAQYEEIKKKSTANESARRLRSPNFVNMDPFRLNRVTVAPDATSPFNISGPPKPEAPAIQPLQVATNGKMEFATIDTVIPMSTDEWVKSQAGAKERGQALVGVPAPVTAPQTKSSVNHLTDLTPSNKPAPKAEKAPINLPSDITPPEPVKVKKFSIGRNKASK